MPRLLHIETSTDVCSVALSEGGTLIAYKETRKGKSHASILAPFIDECLKKGGYAVSQLDAVAVCKGPGSYTGLRIGVSTAKGLCYGASLPLLSVNSLLIMTNKLISTYNHLIEGQDAWFCPMIDAKRKEVYTAFFDSTKQQQSQINATVLSETVFQNIADKRILYCFGDGSKKAKNIISHPNIRFIDNIYPSAESMIESAELQYKNGKFEDIAYFEPLYLKDFVPTKPKNKII